MAEERILPGSTDWVELLFHWHRYCRAADLAAGKTVLDLACGEGYGAHYLAAQAQRVVGIDIDLPAIERARSKYRRSNLEFMTGSAAEIPFPEASFDLVVSLETLEHLDGETQHRFLREVQRVLKPAGQLLISTPDRGRTEQFSEHNPYHQKELFPEEFAHLLQGYFPRVQLAWQEINMASLIWDEAGAPEPSQCLAEYRISRAGDEAVPTRLPLGWRMYVLALCSNQREAALPPLGSLCHEIGRRPLEALWAEINRRNRREQSLEQEKQGLEIQLLRQQETGERLQEQLVQGNEEQLRLRQQLEQADGALRMMEEEKRALQTENRRVLSEIGRIQTDGERLREELAAEQAVRREQTATLAIVQQHNQQLAGGVVEMQRRVDRAEAELAALGPELADGRRCREELEVIRNSRGWKVVRRYWQLMDQPQVARLLRPIRDLLLGSKQEGSGRS